MWEKIKKLLEIITYLTKNIQNICVVNSVGEKEKSIIQRIKENINKLIVYDLSQYAESYLDTRDQKALKNYKSMLDKILEEEKYDVFVIDETLDLDILSKEDIICYFRKIIKIGKKKDFYIALERNVFEVIKNNLGLENEYINIVELK